MSYLGRFPMPCPDCGQDVMLPVNGEPRADADGAIKMYLDDDAANALLKHFAAAPKQHPSLGETVDRAEGEDQ